MNEREEAVVHLIAAHYPFHIHAAEQITNEMFRCQADDREVFARITSYKSYEEQEEEVKLLRYLQSQGVGVSAVVPAVTGRLVECVDLLQSKNMVLFEAASGIHLQRARWNGDIFRLLGRQIGRMHKTAARYEELNGRRQAIKDWYNNEEYNFLKHIPVEETSIRAAAEGILSEVLALPRNAQTYGLIHGDIWLENVLVDDQSRLTLIDFQDCERHYYLYDLAVPLFSALEYSFAGKGNIQDYGQNLAENLFSGYLEEHPLNSGMLEKLPLLFKVKELFEYTLMHMHLDMEALSEEQVRIMNLYRMRLENGIPAVHLDEERLLRLLNA